MVARPPPPPPPPPNPPEPRPRPAPLPHHVQPHRRHAPGEGGQAHRVERSRGGEDDAQGMGRGPPLLLAEEADRHEGPALTDVGLDDGRAARGQGREPVRLEPAAEGAGVVGPEHRHLVGADAPRRGGVDAGDRGGLPVEGGFEAAPASLGHAPADAEGEGEYEQAGHPDHEDVEDPPAGEPRPEEAGPGEEEKAEEQERPRPRAPREAGPVDDLRPGHPVEDVEGAPGPLLHRGRRRGDGDDPAEGLAAGVEGRFDGQRLDPVPVDEDRPLRRDGDGDHVRLLGEVHPVGDGGVGRRRREREEQERHAASRHRRGHPRPPAPVRNSTADCSTVRSGGSRSWGTPQVGVCLRPPTPPKGGRGPMGRSR